MKTKLVYVLTCDPEGSYIEQALMAVWSARYHNPDAHIVLITDDKTDMLLDGKRGELINYITEKIVVPFDADKNMHYRSRWLKTNVRELVKGDYLFIDCDTIVTKNLSSIEDIDADVAMVCDENLEVERHSAPAANYMISNCAKIGLDISKEKYYFNSGVIYVRDTELSHKLYALWHDHWLAGVAKGLNIDQPTLAKANIDMGRPIHVLDNRWNAIIPSQIEEIYDSYILHFWHSVSFLYTPACMNYIRVNGITPMIEYYLLHPTETFIPSDSHVSLYGMKDFRTFYQKTVRALKEYGNKIDNAFSGLEIRMRSNNLIHRLLKVGCYRSAAWMIVLSKMYRVKCSKKFVYKENYYSA